VSSCRNDLTAGVLIARTSANSRLSLGGHCSSSTQAFGQHLRGIQV
jgi:hypothetical protein